MIHVICVLKSGGDFTPDHVHALRDSCLRWLPEHQFLCLTDQTEKVECQSEKLTTDARGWWAKMELFREFRGPTLYLDLDTVLRADSSALVDAAKGHGFVAIRDFYRGLSCKNAIGSGLMWIGSDMRWVWDAWQSYGARSLRGDQDFLEECFRERGFTPAFWQDLAKDQICSFKANIRDTETPSFSPVVCFHGKPRPWEQDIISYPRQTHPVLLGQSVIIVGNGPSLKRQRLGGVIDSFDQVIRINSFEISGLETFTGKRTTIHATHGKHGGRKAEFSCDHTLWLHEHAAWDVRHSWLVPKSFYWGLVSDWAPDKSILPSAGFVTVAWLLKNGVKKAHLAGFDHFSKSSHLQHHYWESVAKTQPKEHSPEREEATFEQWRKDGFVSYL